MGSQTGFREIFYGSLYFYQMLSWKPNLVDIGVEIQKVGRK